MDERKKPTIVDVARRAGVSNATVSMVMSGNPKITEKTNELVTQAIRDLNYTRQRKVKQKKQPDSEGPNLIGLVTYCDYPFQWWFAREFILTIKEELILNGYLTIMFYCTSTSDSQKLYREIISAHLDGLIVLQYNDAELFGKIQANGLPMVLINNSNFQFRFHSVCADDYQGAYDGTLELIKNGHQDIAFLDFFRPNQPATVFARYFGFRKAMEDFLLPFSSNHRVTVELHDLEALQKALSHLLEIDPEITAFFIHDDYFTLDVMKVLLQMGKRIPDDISIVAPGDTISYGEPFVPDISTMQINREEMGRETVAMLLDVIRDEQKAVGIKKSNETFINRGTIKNVLT
jgi:LacI family transcriptional regulator